MTIRALLPLIALPLLLAGCATPAQRITRNLAELGVPQRQAQCMGDRLGQRLSIGQLLRLQELTSIRMERLERMSLRQIADKLTDEKDPGLVAEFLRAGLGCAF
ncbi:MAG: hypothetical protein KGQ52_08885 [Alphaproteobacteria bacterium]|nr:hypothetical protein [Alphaproteobacteria bacterium]